jgi:hypothetical protein
MRTLLLALTIIGVFGVGSAGAAATAPTNTSRPAISGTAQQGKTLTADPGKWAGTQPITFTYQWRRCDSNGASCANIIGATTKTYAAASVDSGNTLRVHVRATNSAGSGNATSAPTAVIAPPTSVSLDTTNSVVVYGRQTHLNGSVENGQAGDRVAITERRVPAVGGVQTQSLASVTTASDGSFGLAVRPRVHTFYRATVDNARSNNVSVLVRPLVRLTAIGRHHFLVRALAARSFVGKFASLQRWSRFRHRWVGVKLVFFRSAMTEISPTTISRAVFRTRLHARIRVVIPNRQAAPGYVTGFSNALRT